MPGMRQRMKQGQVARNDPARNAHFLPTLTAFRLSGTLKHTQIISLLTTEYIRYECYYPSAPCCVGFFLVLDMMALSIHHGVTSIASFKAQGNHSLLRKKDTACLRLQRAYATGENGVAISKQSKTPHGRICCVS